MDAVLKKAVSPNPQITPISNDLLLIYHFIPIKHQCHIVKQPFISHHITNVPCNPTTELHTCVYKKLQKCLYIIISNTKLTIQYIKVHGSHYNIPQNITACFYPHLLAQSPLSGSDPCTSGNPSADQNTSPRWRNRNLRRAFSRWCICSCLLCYPPNTASIHPLRPNISLALLFWEKAFLVNFDIFCLIAVMVCS